MLFLRVESVWSSAGGLLDILLPVELSGPVAQGAAGTALPDPRHGIS